MPKISLRQQAGRLPKRESLRSVVEGLLNEFDHVIAITDVYTGQREFESAEDAKRKMREWVGPEPRFHPHAAQYEFEAWLLPYWQRICVLASVDVDRPKAPPEEINHGKPPSRLLSEVFVKGRRTRYLKTRDAAAILKDQDLMISIQACPELKALVNTILRILEEPEIA